MRRSLPALHTIIFRTAPNAALCKSERHGRTASTHSIVHTVWDQLDQRVIDRAVQERRVRLRTCVKAKGGYFEQTL